MSYFVTGATGFIGRHLVERLLEREGDIHVLVREGHFTEDSFDEGQKLTHPYHRTKYEAEKLVRQRLKVPWRVYRPSIVVGNSKTGEMDKIDGPYNFFKTIQKTRHALPEWFPLVGIEVGKTNIVPVDYVAAAMDHIAHLPDLDGQAFHLVDPKMKKAGDVINTFAQAGHAPKMVLRIDKKMTDMLPKGVLSYAMKLPALKDIRSATSTPTSSRTAPSSTRSTAGR
jgi:thioester reductase-like protein